MKKQTTKHDISQQKTNVFIKKRCSLGFVKHSLVIIALVSLIVFSLVGAALIQKIGLEEEWRILTFIALFGIGFGNFVFAIWKITGQIEGLDTTA
ncbi:MAG: hypothetical protein R3E32_25290 [Chitinophagales bacterium]